MNLIFEAINRNSKIIQENQTFFVSFRVGAVQIGIPVICFTTSLLYGMKNGFNFILSVIVGILFIPTIFIYYNSSAWPYIIWYSIISLIGNLVGGFFV